MKRIHIFFSVFSVISVVKLITLKPKGEDKMSKRLTKSIMLSIILQIFILSSFVSNIYAEDPVQITYTYDKWGNLIIIEREITEQRVVASSFEAFGLEADKAVDGDFSTRWSSKFEDPQWIYIDFVQPKKINRVSSR